MILDRDRPLLATMAATIYALQYPAMTPAEALHAAKALLRELDNELQAGGGSNALRP